MRVPRVDPLEGTGVEPRGEEHHLHREERRGPEAQQQIRRFPSKGVSGGGSDSGVRRVPEGTDRQDDLSDPGFRRIPGDPRPAGGEIDARGVNAGSPPEIPLDEPDAGGAPDPGDDEIRLGLSTRGADGPVERVERNPCRLRRAGCPPVASGVEAGQPFGAQEAVDRPAPGAAEDRLLPSIVSRIADSSGTSRRQCAQTAMAGSPLNFETRAR